MPNLKDKVKRKVINKVEEWIHGPPSPEKEYTLSEDEFDDMLFYGRHDPRTEYKGGLTKEEHFVESPNKQRKNNSK